MVTNGSYVETTPSAVAPLLTVGGSVRSLQTISLSFEVTQLSEYIPKPVIFARTVFNPSTVYYAYASVKDFQFDLSVKPYPRIVVFV